MGVIYYGEYFRRIMGNQCIILPEHWEISEIIYFILVENKNNSCFLYCSCDTDAFQFGSDYGNELTRGIIRIEDKNKLILPDKFLNYINKKNKRKLICYGNVDHFEIWIPEELKAVEDEIDTEDIAKELQELGLLID